MISLYKYLDFTNFKYKKRLRLLMWLLSLGLMAIGILLILFKG